LHANTTANLDANTSLAITSMDLHGNQLTKTGTGTLLINDQSNTHTLGAIDCQEGICSGDGTVGGNLSNHAVVSPGNGIGVLTVNGNFGQDENGTLLIELLSGGGVAGTDYDHFYVAGTAHLAGALDLDIVAGHGITIGDRLPSIVTAGMISGIFSTVSGAAIDGRKGLAVTYSNTSVDVDVALRGNTDVANGDTDVDTGDLTTSIINFTSAEGKGKTWADGDMDGDGDVDTGDLTTSIINFTGAQRATALPEPGGRGRTDFQPPLPAGLLRGPWHSERNTNAGAPSSATLSWQTTRRSAWPLPKTEWGLLGIKYDVTVIFQRSHFDISSKWIGLQIDQRKTT